MGGLRIQVSRLAGSEDLPLPSYATSGAAGMDLRASEDVVLGAGERLAVPTGLVVALPEGYEGQVRCRSGLALRHGLSLVNGVGTIDSDYRGEVKVLMVNLGSEEVVLKRGERVAQMVVVAVERVELEESENLSETSRGTGGFGSTGT
ncbi:MAG: dUTP diphosphatase [Alphaproteobacteria bacterium]|nr:dUTP diphosphatase [Alphaproteobacteria bacterium]MDA8003704.1 dUTP diphosphatase [Alphaproteobacteria bacterium]MDA8006351.1 dUTP diphosphatase [Alphaproteobacteria bacterium]MDA8013696.1 dUTP diphosphatase [Alphaproteobacteria bacterium]